MIDRLQSVFGKWLGPVGSAVLLILLLAPLASLGGFDVPRGHPEAETRLRIAAAASAYWSVIISGGLGAAYLGAAFGFGRLLSFLYKASPSRLWIQAGVGLALMLVLSQVLGMAGLLSGPRAAVAAWVSVGIGLALLADQVVRGELRPEKWPVMPGWVMLGIPGLAVLLVAASSPPGWLWESEKGGFDAMSYHLQLPREWAETGAALRPLEHSVYSYLPGYVEGAYLHLAGLARPIDARRGSAPLVGEQGVGVVACQMLHAGLAAMTALLAARCTLVLLRRQGLEAAKPGPEPDRAGVPAAAIAGAMVISIPWVIVVGSLAYNEMATTALGAAALLVAADRDLSTLVRGLLAGMLVGAACSAKPTAAMVVTPWVGAALLGLMPARRWPAAVAVGAVAGLAVMMPWLARNIAACGNAFFPFGASLLGPGHWSEEQLARYAGAHAFSGSVLDRLRVLVSADRGMAHAQWSVFFLEVPVALLIAAARPALRHAAAILAIGIALSIASWAAATHMQSRFLVPLVVPGSIAVGLAVSAVLGTTRRAGAGVLARAALTVACAALPLAMAAQAALIFASQRDAKPNVLLPMGVAELTGGSFDRAYASATDLERAQLRQEAPTPEIYANMVIDPDETIYLLGDSTPLYLRGRTLYHTTWDASPLGDAIRANPGDPGAWTEALRARGVKYVLVNQSELERLIEKDRWYDPAVTPEAVKTWIKEGCEPVRGWADSGRYLLRLKGPNP
ncbi:MAG: hypothetical protein KF745_11830 [Phycisphaeraceae bacterium]|nr:hypothetical protein [Phycisphaeraceae bacterium]